MNTLVFTTFDITPEHWEDFAKTAGCPPTGPDHKIHVPYILVHSPSQQDLERTERISATAKTQFGSATWDEIKSSFVALAEPNSQKILTIEFLILDQQSTEDRKAIIIEKGLELVTPEGNEALSDRQENLTRMTVWRKYRVPFEDAFAAQCGIEGFCSKEAADEFFEEEIEREVATKD